MRPVDFARTFLAAVVLAGVPAWLYGKAPDQLPQRSQLAADMLVVVAAQLALVIAAATIFLTGLDGAVLRSRRGLARTVLMGYRWTFALALAVAVVLLAYRLACVDIRDDLSAGTERGVFAFVAAVFLWSTLATWVLVRNTTQIGLAAIREAQ